MKLVNAATCAASTSPTIPFSAVKYSQEIQRKIRVHAGCQLKAAGTCTDTTSGDTKFEAWEEGSALKEYTYKITGGTGKYQDASGGGTYYVRKPDGYSIYRRHLPRARSCCPSAHRNLRT